MTPDPIAAKLAKIEANMREHYSDATTRSDRIIGVGFADKLREALRAYDTAKGAEPPSPAMDDLDVLVVYQGKDGRRDWQEAGAWLMPGECIAVVPQLPTAAPEAREG